MENPLLRAVRCASRSAQVTQRPQARDAEARGREHYVNYMISDIATPASFACCGLRLARSYGFFARTVNIIRTYEGVVAISHTYKPNQFIVGLLQSRFMNFLDDIPYR